MQPTYEGLKPEVSLTPDHVIRRLQPTYEGLKPPSRLNLDRDYRTRLQPTYEGLKPVTLPPSART